MKGIFLTGTDTDVGKTVVAAALLQGAPAALGLKYWKPVQTGSDHDADTVARLVGEARQSSVHGPAAHFALPASPHHAAEMDGAHVGVAELVVAASDLAGHQDGSPFIVEGAGGWMVPLNRQELWPDLVETLELPVLVVASTRLGCINHSLLTLRAIGQRALGLILVGDHDPSAVSGIGAHTTVPIVGHLEQVCEITPAQVRTWGTRLWAGPLLEIWKRKVGAW